MNVRRPKTAAVLVAGILSAIYMTSNAGVLSLLPEYSHVSIATQLTEVQKGTFDGRNYLTLHIGGHDVGPSSCRSNILRIDTSTDSGLGDRHEQIESIALSALVRAETVMIVVPLDISKCVDGKPTFTDLYLLSSRL